MERSADTPPRDGAIVALFDDPAAAHAAAIALAADGFPLDRVALVARDHTTEEHVLGLASAADGLAFWGRRGALWGDVARTLRGAALFLLPDIGHVLVFGPLGGWMMRALGGAAVPGGVSALGAGLAWIGVPVQTLPRHDADVRDGRCLLVVTGAVHELARAHEVLRGQMPVELRDHLRAAVPA